MNATAEEVIQHSEVNRHEQAQPFNINFKPMYSLERIRRRALCEALCEGIPDVDLLAMRENFRRVANAALRQRCRPMKGVTDGQEPKSTADPV